MQTIDNIYENLEDCNPTRKRNLLGVFDNMIEVMGSNKKLSPIVAKLFLKEKKLNIFFVFISQSFISQSYFLVSKFLKL